MAACYRFGRVEVRPAERQLLVEGRPAPLGARAFDVLMALIDRRDRVVTKDELLDVVWPGLVVEENNLQVQVSTLRKHLGARAVATIPGRGYRFTLEPESPDATSGPVSAPRHNLPAQLNRFIGRERELVEVKTLLAHTRLVTLTSLGGTGKTRLSLQVAHELVAQFPDGAWFVELAPVADESRVPHAVAAVLGVQHEAGGSVIDALTRWARDRNLLLVLDNCEHVLRSAADLVKQLLQAAPSLHVLASSREALRVNGETVYPLSPLPTPDLRYATSTAILEEYDAVRLFVDRATAANGSFQLTDSNVPAVAAICRRLDGIPLAIELAAARVRALSVENIAARLDDRFRLLTGGDPTTAPRQQTLRASLDWSYELLVPAEATLLRRLAVFAGGWTLEAAEVVAAGGEVDSAGVLDLLTRLVEKSFVDIDAYGERYRLLETVRQYALEKLEASGEAAAVRERHFAFYVDFAQKARPHLAGPDQAAWLQRMDQDLENLLAAHAAASGPGAQRLVTSIRHYCLNRGLGALAHRMACDSLARLPERNRARCDALFDAGQISHFIGRDVEARKYLEESLDIARQLGDRAAQAVALQPLGMACLALGDLAAARPHLENGVAMAREGGHDREIAAALNALGQVPRLEGNFDGAAELYEEAVTRARRLDDRETVAIGLLNLAMVAVRRKPAERARLTLEALQIAEELGSRYVGQSALDVCAGLCALVGDARRCARFYGASEAQSARTGLRRDAADEAFLSPLLGDARKRGDAAAFLAAEAEGRALAYEEAIREARACLEKFSC
ncbi:MAG TPA: winged helix-turn-helix domain-containing protein [Usitatibacter sp.]|nr:winged helix-turn-helix domain-containing protein [Usitatibacter sp.]